MALLWYPRAKACSPQRAGGRHPSTPAVRGRILSTSSQNLLSGGAGEAVLPSFDEYAFQLSLANADDLHLFGSPSEVYDSSAAR